ncbi:hypothetical protein FQN57_007470 [Myotisia sp. PD_48]|nr:hypothetical protein FQN57_007470 [Myotisia sp. PD_48]
MFEGFSFPTPPPSSSGQSRQDNTTFSSSYGSINQPDSDTLHLQCDSNLVSPLSSRCPSPMLAPPLSSREFPRLNRRSRQFQPPYMGPAPTSIPPSYSSTERDSRFSVGSLTKQLNAHSLDNYNDGSSDSDDGRWLPMTPPRGSHPVELPPDFYLPAPALSSRRPPRSSLHPPRIIDAECDDTTSHFPPWLDSASPPSLSSPSSPKFQDRRFSLPAGRDCQPTDRQEAFYSTPHSRTSVVMNDAMHQDMDLGIDDEGREIRFQREKISLLQCASSSVADTVRLALLIEGDMEPDAYHSFHSYGSDGGGACSEGAHGESFDEAYLDAERHPSSLSPSRSPSRRSLLARKHPKAKTSNLVAASPSTTSRFSGVMGCKSKVEKPHCSGTAAGYSSRRCGKSKQNLRRKSLVLAAVTAALEQEAAGRKNMR